MTATPAMTILFGGSFDPVHEGHLKTAIALRDLLGVPTVSLLPAARSPLKPESTADSHRLAMLQLAIADCIANNHALTIDDRELRRPPPSYTVDTLLELRAEIGTDAPLVWVMGADTLAGLSQWKNWQSLARSGASADRRTTGHDVAEQKALWQTGSSSCHPRPVWISYNARRKENWHDWRCHRSRFLPLPSAQHCISAVRIQPNLMACRIVCGSTFFNTISTCLALCLTRDTRLYEKTIV
jgi:nicotinate (nicotinamide) nucleotide adenylyltransferase